MSDAPVTMKTGSISGQTMHTREKIGNLCKRLLCSIVENKKSSQSIKEVATVIGGDSRKVVDLVFILESLGLITRILKNTFVYTGFRGMIQRFLEFAQYKVKKNKAYDQNSRLMTEDLSIGGKGIPIKSSIYLGKFVSVIVWTALLDTNKKISRGEVDTIFEEYSQYFKDSSSATKSIVNDMINLLIALNFFEKNELNDSLTWSGPDCINSVGLTNDNVYDIDNLPDVIKPKRNINYDSREYTYFKNLLKDEIASNKIVLKAENFSWSSPNEESFVKDPNSSLNLYPLSSFEQGGYALLKGKTWQYLMTKPCAIIGRLPNNKDTVNKKYKWEVDVDLVNSPSVSRQHAVILYNYEEETFEIKCLSKKNPVKVGDFIYDSKDKACPLESKTLVTLGGESFYFYLPNLPSEKIEEDKQDKKEEKDKNDEEGSGKEEEEDKEEDKEAKEDDEEQIKGDDEREGEEEEGEEGAKKMEEEEDDVDDEDEEEEGDDEGDGDGEGEGMETE